MRFEDSCLFVQLQAVNIAPFLDCFHHLATASELVLRPRDFQTSAGLPGTCHVTDDRMSTHGYLVDRRRVDVDGRFLRLWPETDRRTPVMRRSKRAPTLIIRRSRARHVAW